jgi:hypothetical protein
MNKSQKSEEESLFASPQQSDMYRMGAVPSSNKLAGSMPITPAHESIDLSEPTGSYDWGRESGDSFLSKKSSAGKPQSNIEKLQVLHSMRRSYEDNFLSSHASSGSKPFNVTSDEVPGSAARNQTEVDVSVSEDGDAYRHGHWKSKYLR